MLKQPSELGTGASSLAFSTKLPRACCHTHFINEKFSWLSAEHGITEKQSGPARSSEI